MGLHFLIIDDSDLNIKVIGSLLGKLNITSDHVTSALDAYSLLEEKKYDMLLMDYMMPDVNGVEAAEYIRNMFSQGFDSGYFEKIPIVMLTAEENLGAIVTENSYNEYLKKPVTLSALTKTITKFFPDYLSYDNNEKIHIEGLDADPEECYSYLEIFVSTVGNIVMTIKMALQTQDYSTYTCEVHRLKGEAQIISANALAEYAYELECIGKAVTGVYPNGKTDEENIEAIKERTPVLFSMVDNLKNHFVQYKKGNVITDNSTEDNDNDDNSQKDVSTLTESFCLDIETKDRIVRYLDYALESINENNIVNAITWLDGIKDILNSQ